MVSYPLVEEISLLCPESVFAALPQQGALFLDSSNSQTNQGRYSFIAFDPFEIILCKNNKVFLGKDRVDNDPFRVLEKRLIDYVLTPIEGLPPFQGGVAGMLGYELGGYLEKIPRSLNDDLLFPEMLLGLYDLVIAFDHHLSKSWIFSSGFPEKDMILRQARAKERLQYAKDLIANSRTLANIASFTVKSENICSTFNQTSYETAVSKVIEYIRAGDIFEANISQRFSCQLPEEFSGFDLYRRLRRNNPAPFSAFMQYDNFTIASASPERFLQLQQGNIEARPIKGTRPRSQHPEEDLAFANELLQSEKDRAENIMIVDLMRNDISRVCLPHSVVVPSLCGLESFATVHHLVSVVKGTLQPDKKAIDLLKATFPGGSITGAPKIRTMEIIAQIEPTVRGPYCGSMGYIGFNGNMDLSITIRTFALRDNFCTFQTGGAITVDSDPCDEYFETLAKAKALRKTLVSVD